MDNSDGNEVCANCGEDFLLHGDERRADERLAAVEDGVCGLCRLMRSEADYLLHVRGGNGDKKPAAVIAPHRR